MALNSLAVSAKSHGERGTADDKHQTLKKVSEYDQVIIRVSPPSLATTTTHTIEATYE